MKKGKTRYYLNTIPSKDITKKGNYRLIFLINMDAKIYKKPLASTSSNI